MTIRYAPHLLALILASTTLIGCSSGGGDSTPTTPSYTVTTTLLGGTASPANPSVKEGGSAIITLTADEGYTLDAASVTGCDGVLVGNIYTTGPITVACTVTAGFVPTAGVAQVTLGYGIKQLTFAWPVVSGATHYKLLENPDGASGYTQVGNDLTSTSATRDISVHLHDWVNAKYMVEAWNDDGEKVISNEVTTTVADAVNAIGYVKASNTRAEGNFGDGNIALSSDGMTMAVGAIGDASNATGVDGNQDDVSAPWSGAVYIYTYTNGNWSQQAYLKGLNTEAGDLFGYSVSLSGDGNTLVVGASAEDSNGTGGGDNSALSAGAAYVFTRSGAVWSQQAYLKAGNAGEGDRFGLRVGLSGDGNTVAVAAMYEDGDASVINGTDNNFLSNAGAAYIFVRSGESWSQQAYVKPANPGVNDSFGGGGIALSYDGNTLAVGATGEDGDATVINGADNDLALNAGAAYVFVRNISDWAQQAYVKAPNGEASDGFGASVSLSDDGNTLAVSAYGESSNATGVCTVGDAACTTAQSDNSLNWAGAVYLFSRNSGSWSAQSYVKASNIDADDNFSLAALSGDGTTLAVGAWSEDSNATGIDGIQSDNSVSGAGAVFLFTLNAGSWSQQAYIKAPNPGTNDGFASVALSDDGKTLAVGAWAESSSATGLCAAGETACATSLVDDTAVEAGAVYLY